MGSEGRKKTCSNYLYVKESDHSFGASPTEARRCFANFSQCAFSVILYIIIEKCSRNTIGERNYFYGELCSLEEEIGPS